MTILTTPLSHPGDTFLAEELAHEDAVEMANLTSAQTGVPGTIFISTAMGAHGPRVKYFLQPGRTQPSFSVSINGHAGGRRQQPAGAHCSADVAASHRLGVTQ